MTIENKLDRVAPFLTDSPKTNFTHLTTLLGVEVFQRYKERT